MISMILHCFEIFIERRKKIASNQCWLHYKNHHTVKIFIAIRPQAAISYISKSWGSCNSDILVTEDNDVLHGVLLQPGDLILADRGYKINNGFNLHGAR